MAKNEKTITIKIGRTALHVIQECMTFVDDSDTLDDPEWEEISGVSREEFDEVFKKVKTAATLEYQKNG